MLKQVSASRTRRFCLLTHHSDAHAALSPRGAALQPILPVALDSFTEPCMSGWWEEFRLAVLQSYRPDFFCSLRGGIGLRSSSKVEPVSGGLHSHRFCWADNLITALFSGRRIIGVQPIASGARLLIEQLERQGLLHSSSELWGNMLAWPDINSITCISTYLLALGCRRPGPEAEGSGSKQGDQDARGFAGRPAPSPQCACAPRAPGGGLHEHPPQRQQGCSDEGQCGTLRAMRHCEVLISRVTFHSQTLYALINAEMSP